MKHRYDTVKHFFTDIFTGDQIDNSLRYETPCLEIYDDWREQNGYERVI